MKMIAAVSKSWGIGKEGELLFRIPADMKFFREKTTGAAVLMGRKTLDSFPGGKPLKNRVNIVLTKNKDFSREGVVVCNTSEEALAEAKKYPEVFVIGGADIYKLFLSECSEAYITKVDADAPADKFIDNLDARPEWRLEKKSETQQDNGYKFCFCLYKRIN